MQFPPSPPYDLESDTEPICPLIMQECLTPPPPDQLCAARLSRPQEVMGYPHLTYYATHGPIHNYGRLMLALKAWYPTIVLSDVQILTTMKTKRSSSLIFKSWCPFHQRIHHAQHWFCTTYHNTDKTFVGCFHTRGGKFIRRIYDFSVYDQCLYGFLDSSALDI